MRNVRFSTSRPCDLCPDPKAHFPDPASPNNFLYWDVVNGGFAWGKHPIACFHGTFIENGELAILEFAASGVVSAMDVCDDGSWDRTPVQVLRVGRADRDTKRAFGVLKKYQTQGRPLHCYFPNGDGIEDVFLGPAPPMDDAAFLEWARSVEVAVVSLADRNKLIVPPPTDAIATGMRACGLMIDTDIPTYPDGVDLSESDADEPVTVIDLADPYAGDDEDEDFSDFPL